MAMDISSLLNAFGANGGSVAARPRKPGAGPLGGNMMPGGERPGTYGVNPVKKPPARPGSSGAKPQQGRRKPPGGNMMPGGERPGTYGVNPVKKPPARPGSSGAKPQQGRRKPPGNGGGVDLPRSGGDGAQALPPDPTTPTYDGKNPPPGFTAEQWRRLLLMAKKNPTIAELVKRYMSGIGNGGTTPNPDDAWRRTMPTNTSQLLKQLSYNAGEMGMPGGYVGAIQLPAYGETQAPVNNPDMSKYGQAKGLGEATFYQQSMKGGMAPIAAMSPLGVPEGWNPGGNSSGSGSGNGSGGGTPLPDGIKGDGSMLDLFNFMAPRVKKIWGVNNALAEYSALVNRNNGSGGKPTNGKPTNGKPTNDKPVYNPPGGQTGNGGGTLGGIPIDLPFGF